MAAIKQRPQFTPKPYQLNEKPDPPALIHQAQGQHIQWVPMLSCTADFPPEVFEIAISQLIHHPEYNSTLILRSEIISDTNAPSTSSDDSSPPAFEGVQGLRLRQIGCIHRKLLPRRPGRDGELEQFCSLYTTDEGENALPTTLVLTPIKKPGGDLPYYHPAVSHLAFRYVSYPDTSEQPPILRVEVVPLPGTPTDCDSRLYRTCLALLEALHRYGWGTLSNYKKRVNHDCLIQREVYQDLYLVMRERHKHLIDTWKEVTDPLKHVFEDIGIATYLMLLWKDTFPAQANLTNETGDHVEEPWRHWPRPSGGFLDMGCGNGLLTHILISEGYDGHGIDVRSRQSWDFYPTSTQSHLHIHSLDPTQISPNGFLKQGTFLIGNHADELTPWIPILSTLHRASGYISIPCCAWGFDAKFDRGATLGMYSSCGPSFVSMLEPSVTISDFVESLNLGGVPVTASLDSRQDGCATIKGSSYSVYRVWLAGLSLYCGWKVECDVLRIPSTRNWAIIGRTQLTDENYDYFKIVAAIIDDVKNRGMFKTRKPEGKAGDH